VSGKRNYYPSYYREKRRRERIFLVSSVFVLVVVVIGLGAFLVAYLFRVFKNPVSLEQMVPPQGLAATKQVEKQRKLEQKSPPKKFAEEEQFVTLSDIEGYSQSVPELSIKLEGVSSQTQAEAEEPVPTEETNATSVKVEEEGVENEPAPSTKPAEPGQKAEKEKPAPEEKEKTEQKGEASENQAKKGSAVSDSERKGETSQGGAKASPTYIYSVFAGVERAPKAETSKAEERVRRMSDRLLELGFKPTVIKREQGDEIVFQIQVGSSFDSYELAEALKQKLKESGFDNAYILRRSG